MARVCYIDREGKKIDQEAYKAHLADPSYVTLREFDDGTVRVTLKWIGRVVDPHQSYADLYKVFVMNVSNYTADGALVVDPVDDGQTFPNEARADMRYQEFLKQWTESGVDEFGDFQEANNNLAPPPPIDPNKPASESEELGETGAW